MSGHRSINDELLRKGVIVLEVFSVDLHDKYAEEQFTQNREAVLRELITKKGIEINDFALVRRSEMQLLEKWFTSKSPDLKVAGNFHIVYPANERLGWICCCAD